MASSKPQGERTRWSRLQGQDSVLRHAEAEAPQFIRERDTVARRTEVAAWKEKTRRSGLYNPDFCSTLLPPTANGLQTPHSHRTLRKLGSVRLLGCRNLRASSGGHKAGWTPHRTLCGLSRPWTHPISHMPTCSYKVRLVVLMLERYL